MRQNVQEQTAIFISVVKWVVLAVIIGSLVGASTGLFLKLLTLSALYTAHYKYYYFLLPVMLVFCSWVINTFAPKAKGHGTEKVIEAVHKNNGRIKVWVVPIKLVTTILTIMVGGSVGKEGPSGQIGAGIASLFSDLVRLDDHDRKKLVICGISAGFAAVFGTPISGAIFGIEVLYVGVIMYDIMLPSFIAGIVAYKTCLLFGATYFHTNITFIPTFNESFFTVVVIAGVVFGSASFLFIEAFKYIEHWVDALKWNEYLKNFLGGLILIGLILLLSDKYCGLGSDYIQGQLNGTGEPAMWADFLLKMLFTILVFAFGGSGGVVTPMFFIGAALGSTFAQILHLDTATFAAIGLVSLLSGAANTPIAASIMGLELFGSAIAPYAAISCVISFLMTGHRSIYPSQILSMKKASTVDVSLGKEMSDIEASVSAIRQRPLLRIRQMLVRAWERLK